MLSLHLMVSCTEAGHIAPQSRDREQWTRYPSNAIPLFSESLASKPRKWCHPCVYVCGEDLPSSSIYIFRIRK